MTNQTHGKRRLPLAMLAMAAGLFLGMGQFYERYLKEDAIDIFTDTVYLTSDNQPSGFLSFLERNNQKVIYLSTWLDASLQKLQQRLTQQECHLDVESLAKGNIGNRPLPLPRQLGPGQPLSCGPDFLVLAPGRNTLLRPLYDSFYKVRFRVQGFFSVQAIRQSGADIYYRLVGVEVPLDVRTRFAARGF